MISTDNMKELVNVGFILTPEHLPHFLRPPEQSTFYDTDIADILRMGNRANKTVWHEIMIIQVLQGSPLEGSPCRNP